MFENLEEAAEEIRRHPKLIIAEDFELCLQQTISATKVYENGEVAESGQESLFGSACEYCTEDNLEWPPPSFGLENP